MTNHQTTEASMLRVINQEVLQQNFDKRCYKKALRMCSGNKELSIKHYYALRLKKLQDSSASVAPKACASNQYASTESCPKHYSSRNKKQKFKNSTQAYLVRVYIETWLGMLALLLAINGVTLCAWIYTGNPLSNLPYIGLLAFNVFVVILPWLIAKSRLCSYLSGLSLLCTIAAMLSFGISIKLLKTNPQVKPQSTRPQTPEMNTSALAMIEIVPASERTSSPNEQTLIANSPSSPISSKEQALIANDPSSPLSPNNATLAMDR